MEITISTCYIHLKNYQKIFYKHIPETIKSIKQTHILSFIYLDINSYDTKVEAVAGTIRVNDTFKPLHNAKTPSFCIISFTNAIKPVFSLKMLMVLPKNIISLL